MNDAAAPVTVPQEAPEAETLPAAIPAVKRPFRIDEQLRIFFERTIYPELARRTVPLNGTKLYTYPTEDPRMFKGLYAAFRGGYKPWRSVLGSGFRFYPEHDRLKDGYIIRVRMKDAQDQPLMNWLYQYSHETDVEGKHCRLYLQFVAEGSDELYAEMQANVLRLLDVADRLYPRPEPPVPAR